MKSSTTPAKARLARSSPATTRTPASSSANRRAPFCTQRAAATRSGRARRTVGLYEKYKGGVQFVIVDLDHRGSTAQKELKKECFRGNIPHVVVLDASGSTLYNRSGEVDDAAISNRLDK